ncbi:MAG: hypothetical protein J3R72DRAFT_431632 [Linnemannia gamsii]|nr:MAG: hypothetical protein J3R72DRAFT_431632 [Linnemannia gamsii]
MDKYSCSFPPHVRVLFSIFDLHITLIHLRFLLGPPSSTQINSFPSPPPSFSTTSHNMALYNATAAQSAAVSGILLFLMAVGLIYIAVRVYRTCRLKREKNKQAIPLDTIAYPREYFTPYQYQPPQQPVFQQQQQQQQQHQQQQQSLSTVIDMPNIQQESSSHTGHAAGGANDMVPSYPSVPPPSYDAPAPVPAQGR